MKHPFLSDAWIEAARDIRRRHEHEIPPIPHAVRINVVTRNAPFGSGTVEGHIDTGGGGLQVETGLLPDADLTVTTDYDTARELFVDQDPARSMQAFMSGRIKVEGDITRLIVLQTSLVPDSDAARAVAEEVRAITA